MQQPEKAKLQPKQNRGAVSISRVAAMGPQSPVDIQGAVAGPCLTARLTLFPVLAWLRIRGVEYRSLRDICRPHGQRCLS